MKHQRLFLTHILLLLTLWVGAAGFKPSYYTSANGKKGEELKTALFNIIKVTKDDVTSYDGLISAYENTDKRSDGKVRDWYSNTTNYSFSQHTGNYQKEGDMWNREHCVPQSWFNEASPMKSDIVHVVPTDGYVNNRRSSYFFGEVGGTPTYSSNNGYSKLGSSKISGYSGTVFEPNDNIKGDIARIYFYMVTCYQDKCTSWSGNFFTGTTYQPMPSWALTMFMRWSKNDPVDEIEIARNNAVQDTQGNRNPFVDYYGLEEYVWGNYTNTTFSNTNYQDPFSGTIPTTPSISLNQTSASVAVGSTITLTATTQNANGATVIWTSDNTNVATVTNGVVTGVLAGSATITAKITVSGNTYFATCDVTVTSGGTQPEGDYVKVTSAPADWSGTYLIVCESASVALNGALSSLDVVSNTISVSPSNNQITSTSSTQAAEFTIASRTSGGYSIKTKGGTFIGHSGSSNALKTSSSDDFENTISISNGDVTITCNGKKLRYNAASDQKRFRYFGSDQTAIQLYKKSESAPVVPSITLDQSAVTEEAGNTFTLTATTQNANGATVTWTSDNTNVATVTNGVVSCVASGTCTITASITVSGNTYSATCSVTVVDNSTPGGDGTLENPYSVAEVLALFASNNVPTSNVYAKGIISNIKSLDVSQWTRAQYYISDDGTTNNQFYVYNGKYLNGADFTSDDQLAVGDTVVVYGKLTIYGTTNEFAAGNYIVSLVHPSTTLLGDVNKDGEISIADVTALVNIILGKDNAEPYQYDHVAADVNTDGDISIADVTSLVNKILGKTN